MWVSDVTCFKLKDCWYYISAVIDLFSRRVVSYGISPKNSTRLITSTFKAAWSQREPGEGLVFHSNQGAQYTAYSFQKLLRERGVTQSFSNPGTPHDNAVEETFFSTLKKEELYRTITDRRPNSRPVSSHIWNFIMSAGRIRRFAIKRQPRRNSLTRKKTQPNEMEPGVQNAGFLSFQAETGGIVKNITRGEQKGNAANLLRRKGAGSHSVCEAGNSEIFVAEIDCDHLSCVTKKIHPRNRCGAIV